LKHLSKHLTFANAISCIALFVALSGAAYAAKTTLGNKAVKTRNLANGSVTKLKLHRGAVTTLKLRNGAVTGLKIAPGAVGSSQIANGAVRSAALGGGVVTTAKLKNDAVTTNKIQDGAISSGKLSVSFLGQIVRNVTYANAESANNNEGAKTATALCPAGKQAIGGGARVNGELEEVAVTGANPFVAADGQRTGWSAFGRELPDEPGAKKWAVEAFAVCAEI
jgi:trimeric autotransporter adhesin